MCGWSDVHEQIEDNPNLLNVAWRYFSKPEIKQLRALINIDRQLEQFFELWTLKESFIKACGLGLSLPLDKFTFDIDNERIDFSQPKLHLPEGADFQSLHWQSWLIPLKSRHKLSVTLGQSIVQQCKLKVFYTQP